MQLFYHQSINVLWLAWAIVWMTAAWLAKPTLRREGIGSRLSHYLPLLVGAVLMTSSRLSGPLLSTHYMAQSLVTFWVAFCLTALGLAFAVLARVWLGGNWSGLVTLKQDHELIRSGPYRLVRHPIYTGLLLALLGSAIGQTEWRGLVALALFAGAFVWKLRIEETFMLAQFGEVYERYRAEVPALIPLLF